MPEKINLEKKRKSAVHFFNLKSLKNTERSQPSPISHIRENLTSSLDS